MADRLDELEHDATTARDPLDREEKLSFFNREKNVRAFIANGGSFAFVAGEHRVDLDAPELTGVPRAFGATLEAEAPLATTRFMNTGAGISHTIELFDRVLADDTGALVRFAVRGLRPVVSGHADVLFLDADGTPLCQGSCRIAACA